MKTIKGRYLALILEAILFVIWNVLVWVLSATLANLSVANVFFWLGYVFNVIAFAAVAVVLLLVKSSKNANFSVLSPTYIFSAIFFAIVIIMNSVFIAFGFGWPAPIAAVLVPNLVLLLAYAGAVIASVMMIGRTEKLNDEIDKKYASIKGLGISVGTIAAMSEDAEVKRALLALRESIDYSDPMGRPETEDAELDLANKIDEIKFMVQSGDEKDDILKKIKNASVALTARNETLKSLK